MKFYVACFILHEGHGTHMHVLNPTFGSLEDAEKYVKNLEDVRDKLGLYHIRAFKIFIE